MRLRKFEDKQAGRPLSYLLRKLNQILFSTSLPNVKSDRVRASFDNTLGTQL